ncbi:hypothetical protein TIFTF001_025322 [Ficus carica]|uniref:Uncharacterized protein n=1 Tax=Ficus carica TaxID=3494 RepID=A0AA88AWM4_FICCA|nr:hypothetical protein TIFTF001_025322 [Ficus carica]
MISTSFGMISTWSEMMSDELGGSPMISLMPRAKISSVGMVIVVYFDAEHAIFGEGKLPLLDLGMNKEGFLIFPCYNFGSDVDRLEVDVQRLGCRASLSANEVVQAIFRLILDLWAI